MSDAEFCSDAHRQSHAEEQELAMRRLAESSALQRTQRMAAATAIIAPSSDTAMTIVAGPIPVSPAPLPGLLLEIPSAPLSGSPLVLFLQREHSFSAKAPFSDWLLAPSLHPALPATAQRAVIGQSPVMRIVIPRSLGARPALHRRWTRRRPITLLALESTGSPALAPLQAAELAAIPGNPDIKHVSRRASHRVLGLPATETLEPVTRPVAGEIARPLPWTSRTDGICTVTPLLPRSRTAVIAPQTGQVEVELAEELWDVLAAHPLGGLLAATHYLVIRPTQPPRKAQSAPDILRFAAAPATYGSLRAAVPVGDMPVALGLQPVPASSLPACSSAPDRVQTVLALKPFTRYSTAGNRIPGRALSRTTRSLVRSYDAQPIPELDSAAGNRRPYWDSTWAVSPTPRTISGKRRAAARAALGSASCAALPKLRPSMRKPKPVIAETDIPPVFREWRPASAFVSIGARPAPGAQVRCELRPDLAVATRSAPSPQTLHPVLRVRLPLYVIRRLQGHSGADCVALAQPRAQQVAARPVAAEPASLCPAAVLPSLRNIGGPRLLGRVASRVFRVPKAQPTAQQSSSKPRIAGFDSWGAAPAFCRSGLRDDDGRPRRRTVSASKFSFNFRDRIPKPNFKEFWYKASHLPSDLKWIAMVVPLIIGIWILARPSTAEPVSANIPVHQPQETPLQEKEINLASLKPVVAPPTVEEEKAIAAIPADSKPGAGTSPVPNPGAWANITSRISGRASVDLTEDFHNGLSQWDGRGEWARSWSYDKTGTVRPGHFAIFQPSVGLRDYVFEMKASIERRSIQWMVCASGAQNYHLARLNVTPGAPLTKLEFERLTVVNGHAGRVTRLPLPHGGANQTLYSIRVEAKGDSITTYLQDQVIDTFNDSRLQDGGIGLVGSMDDRPRIYGIHVFHQNDFFGKLCSFLAPPPIANQGSN